MVRIEKREECCGCGACAAICPIGCISMEADSEGFAYPQVDSARCVGCNRCDDVCPFGNATPGEERADATPRAYAARSTDDKVRASSSSGGVFSALCESIFQEGGVAFGVAMDEDCRGCSFTSAEDRDSLAPLRGSKYMQADALSVYKRVRSELETGRPVLFSGTPCQVNALSMYLGKDWPNLTKVDFVCHGVPPQMLWDANVDDVERRTGRTVCRVNFRSKRLGWSRFGLDISDDTEKSVYEPLDKSPYLRLFLSNCCLRPSCYSCRAKTWRTADITIADFWGVGKILPEMDDDLGCSLVMVRSQRGGQALAKAKGGLRIREVSYRDAIQFNPAEHSSAGRPATREAFFNDFHTLDYDALVKKYASPTLPERLRRIARNSPFGQAMLRIRNLIRGGSLADSMSYGIRYYLDERATSDMA